MTNLKFAFFAILTVVFAASCSSDSSTKDAARQSIDNTAQAVTDAVSPDAATQEAPAVPEPTGPTTTMSWENTEFDFGTIEQNEIVEHAFKFTNTGKDPLIISNAKGSCGCTVPQWPREPIAPGATASIDVRFDSKGKRNKQNKKVTITANTEPAQTFIYLKGEVNAPEADAAQPTHSGGGHTTGGQGGGM